MAEDHLRTAIDGIRARLQADLEAQLGALTETHEQALDRARQSAESEAERRWASRLEATRAEWSARLQSEVAAARSEVERTMVAESMRTRVEAEQAAAEAASIARREMEEAVAAERDRAEAQIEAERQRGQAQIDAERQRAQREVAQARAAFDAERDRTAQALEQAQRASSSTAGVSALLDAVRAIDRAESLSEALAAVVRGAAAEAPRVVLFIVNGAQLQEWPVTGVPQVHAGLLKTDGREAGLLAEVLRRNEPLTTDRHDSAPAPAFASLPPGRTALAVPFVLGGQAVAVLYADEGADGRPASSWRETVQILGRHASAYVAFLTAMRTAQAMRLMGASGSSGPSVGPDSEQDDAHGARRYARLLVSEIKLYNEGAVRVGREKRDLMQRLKTEIERARRMYDERVPPSIRAREVYFEQELVQTLADGDHSLLG